MGIRRDTPNINSTRGVKPRARAAATVGERTRRTLIEHIHPILEYDRSRASIIEPARVHRRIDIPEHCVPCFFRDVITQLVADGARELTRGASEAGEYAFYELNYSGRRLAVFHPLVGAPIAVARVERAIALGARKFVACGGAGALDGGLGVGHIVVPRSAVRDEGTSYHYLPASREVAPSPRALAAVKKTLRIHGHEFVIGKTWTTDAVYRETPAKIRRRRAEGCVTVEMEAAAFFAVARFRRVEFAQILYAADDVSGSDWDHRNWMRHQARERIFHLAAEACLRL
jgi:uridine phosphorylase